MSLVFLRRLTVATALGFGLITSAAAAQYTTLDTDASQVSFAYSQMNVGMSGGFGQVQATGFAFDPSKPETAQVVIEIPLASIDAGYEEANDELEKDEWLALANHPLAKFESTEVKALGDNRYEVTGQLTIKGRTKEVTVPFTFHEEGNSGIFEGSFAFQRADFGIGEGMWGDFSIVANEIEIKFRLIAKA